MIRSLCHKLIHWYSKKNYDEFKQNLLDPHFAQIKTLNELTGSSYEDFKNHFPITTYAQWREFIEEDKARNPKKHFVPTSGSTEKIKWIPYTNKFKAELWKASSPWIHDLYERYPGIQKGMHYWSLSWLPQEMRAEQKSNDLDFFSGLERTLLDQTMALSENVANLPTLKESMQESLISLLEKEVTLISIWSPTFLLELLEQLLTDKEIIYQRVTHFKKKEIIRVLENLNADAMKILFPNVAVISAWDTGSSKLYADKISALFPHAQFEGKGLWATEGVVTIPFEGKYPLAINSHFYEFQDVDNQKIYPAWELKKGMKVIPIITTGSRLIRYRLGDVLLVYDFIEKTPCLQFLGREHTTDLVGEKVSTDLAVSLLNAVDTQYPAVHALSLLAVASDKPHYRLLVEAPSTLELQQEIAEFVEKMLIEHFHYKLARELGQLSSLEVVLKTDAYLEYVKYKEKNIGLKGNIKVEPLNLILE